MSGTINPEQAAADADDGKFFFSLQADENGITELKFRKQGPNVLGVLLGVSDYVNQTFDQPFPSVSHFLHHLAGIAAEVESKLAMQQQQEVADGQASEAANDAGPEAPEAA